MRREISRSVTGLKASLSLRLIVPVLIALLPLSFFARHQIEQNRERSLDQAEAAITTATSALASSERMVITDAGAIVIGLAGLPSVAGTREECEATLRAVADIDHRFANLGVISANGTVTCSALPVPEGTNLGDRTYFMDAMRYDGLAWGAYQVGRITGEPSINLGYPLHSTDGRPIGVVFGAVSVSFLNDQLSMVELPEGASAIVVDRSGTILVDTGDPGRVGDPAYRVSLSTLLQTPNSALVGLFDGEVIASVRELTGGAVVVAMPRADLDAAAFAEARQVLFVGIAAALLGGGMAFLLTWLGVARPITGIRAVVRRLASGDLSQRIRPSSPDGTLNGLAWDVDEMATALQRNAEELRRYAFEDIETGLPNRQALLVRMAQHERGTLVYVRLDSLSDVAAMFGYQAADEVVLETAARIVPIAASRELVARISDGSFAIFFPDADTPGQASARMSRILDALDGGFRIGDGSIEVVTRAGAAILPDDADDPETLMRMAELAARGANRSDHGTLFDPSSDQQKAENLRLLSEMREALLADRFEVFYQPIVPLRGDGPAHFEALIRWTGDDGVRRSPGEFIPLAERTGAIEHIDRWVLGSVGRQLGHWSRQGFAPEVSVNLSAHSLLNEDLPEYLQSVISAFDLDPQQLHIEITETAFLEGFAGPLRVCESLNGMGVSISVDDFGMGYSPMQYLREFPVETLKLDMSLVRDIERDPSVSSVVQGIVLVAQNLRLRTVAEGVETPAAHAALLRLGVTDAQGYYYARPMPPDDALRWARSSRASA